MKKILLALLALLSLASCRKEFQENWETLRLDYKKYSLSAASVQMPVIIYYNGSWTLDVIEGGDWLYVGVDTTRNWSVKGVGVTIAHMRYDKNTGLSRTGMLRVTTDNGEQADIKVTQGGGVGLPQIILRKGLVTLPKATTTTVAAIITNIPLKYFKAQPPQITYTEGEGGWISSFEYLDEELEITAEERENMPDGHCRQASFTTLTNDSGADRKAEVAIALSDADGSTYSATLTVVQTAADAFITLPAEDLILKEGGDRTVAITTNMEEDIAAFTVEVQYPDPAQSGWVSNARIEGGQLKYSVATNDSGVDRTARITVKYGTSSGTITVNQLKQGVDFSNFDIPSLTMLNIWLSAYDKWTATDNITLSADIDLDGFEWTPRDFPGTFDGQGHSVTHLNVNAGVAGFFANLSGTLKNLTVGSATDGSTIVTNGLSTTSNAGVVASATESACIDNVTNYAAISCKTAGSATQVNLGGMIGQSTGAGVVVKNCKNYADISNSAAVKCNIGGIVGDERMAAIKISGCVNSGNITNSGASGNFYGGGIAGRIGVNTGTGTTAAMTDCSSTGNILNTAKVTTLYFGGLLGTASKQASSGLAMSGCSATCFVINKGGSTNLRMAGLVGDYGAGGSMKNCTFTGLVENQGDLASSGNGRIAAICASNTFATLTITNCNSLGATLTNKGSVPTLYIAGVMGFTNNSDTIDGCKINATITNSGTCTTVYAKMIHAYSKGTVKNCSLAGSIDGTELTAENYASYVAHSGVTVSGCSFLTE